MSWIMRDKTLAEAQTRGMVRQMCEAADSRRVEVEEDDPLWIDPTWLGPVKEWNDGRTRVGRRVRRYDDEPALTMAVMRRFLVLFAAVGLASFAGTVILATLWRMLP